jgi:hypothetical protein
MWIGGRDSDRAGSGAPPFPTLPRKQRGGGRLGPCSGRRHRAPAERPSPGPSPRKLRAERGESLPSCLPVHPAGSPPSHTPPPKLGEGSTAVARNERKSRRGRGLPSKTGRSSAYPTALARAGPVGEGRHHVFGAANSFAGVPVPATAAQRPPAAEESAPPALGAGSAPALRPRPDDPPRTPQHSPVPDRSAKADITFSVPRLQSPGSRCPPPLHSARAAG